MTRELSPPALGKAAAEVRDFLGQLKALQIVMAALEEVGGLEKRLDALRRELDEFPTKRQAIEDGIVKAAEGTIRALRKESAGLAAERDRLKVEASDARAELKTVEKDLEARQEELKNINEELDRLKARFSAN